jgi:hypothetical protein
MSNKNKTKGGVIRRRQNALARLEQQLEKGTKDATVKDADGRKRKALVPLEEKDKTRIKAEIERIRVKVAGKIAA